MIALNEPNAYAAEVPFFLPAQSNPTTGVTGVSWTDVGGGFTSQVQYLLPGTSSWANCVIGQIVEKGYGEYAYRLATPGQTGVAGTVWVRAWSVSGAQPAFTSENITELGGDIPVNGSGYLSFYLPDATNPVFNTGITGHSFAAGEVKVCLPNGSFANANLANITEFGFGSYGLLLEGGDTTTNGKAYIHVDIGATSQPFTGFATILGVGGGVNPTPPSPTPVTTSTVASASGPQAIDYWANGIMRLCEQFRFTRIVT